MLKLYKYDDITSYKNFESSLFSKNKSIFDFNNDKVTIDGIDYRISTIEDTNNDNSSSSTTTITLNHDLIQLKRDLVAGNNIIPHGVSEFIYTIDKPLDENNNEIETSLFKFDDTNITIYVDEAMSNVIFNIHYRPV